MALYDDFKSVKKDWARNSIITKVWLILSTFVATGSLTSLSDTVFKLKGFFADGLEWYESHILYFVKTFFLWIGWSIPDPIANLLILFSIYTSAYFRLANSAKSMAMSNMNKKGMVFLLIAHSIFLFCLSINFFTVIDTKFNMLIIVGIGLIIITFTPLCFDEFDSKARFAFYLPIIISVSTLLIIAAISKGLTM
jgi:hypothetical protein